MRSHSGGGGISEVIIMARSPECPPKALASPPGFVKLTNQVAGLCETWFSPGSVYSLFFLQGIAFLGQE